MGILDRLSPSAQFIEVIEWLDNTGARISDKTHVVERITMVDKDTLLYEATIDDPVILEEITGVMTERGMVKPTA